MELSYTGVSWVAVIVATIAYSVIGFVWFSRQVFGLRWAASIADALDRVLPERYFATVQTHLGSTVEADVAEFERGGESSAEGRNGPGGGVALQRWAPPQATARDRSETI